MSGATPAWIRLRIRDADLVRPFYQDILGLSVDESDGELRMSAPGAAEPAIHGVIDPAAQPAGPEFGGLYHVAFKLPRREDLARMYRHLRFGGVTIRGAADHAVSEALYFSDPEGNGVEVYVDRPADSWSWHDEGQVRMTTEGLDLNDLLATTDGEDGMPGGSTLGHVHLRTTDLAGAETFWSSELGLDVTNRDWPGAVFLASDRYHHHLGLNEWGGPLRRRDPGALGLVELAWRVPGLDGERAVEDPDGNPVRLIPA